MRITTPLQGRTFALSAATALILALTACGDKPAESASAPPAPAAAPESNNAPAPAPAPAEPEQQAGSATDKLNVFIGCFNSSFGRAHDAMNRYSSWIKDMKVGPTGQERTVYGTYTVAEHVIAGCGEPVQRAAAAKPAMPALDQAAKDYSSSLAAWGKTLVEADKYYGRENYKDDAMAHGKALHPEMVKNYEAYASATQRFSDALEAENDKLHLQQLAEIEKTEGKTFPWWHGMTMFKAKKSVDALSDKKVDLDKAQARMKDFEETADGLAAYAKQPNAKLPMMWAMYEVQLEQYRIAAKQRLRSVRDKGGAVDSSDDGSANNMVEAYNQLIQTSNMLQ